MKNTILIGTNRETGKDELIAGRDVGFQEQTESYRKLAVGDGKKYSNVLLAYVEPAKRLIRFSDSEPKPEAAPANTEGAPLEAPALSESKPLVKPHTPVKQPPTHPKHRH